jgi:hypothetical protein
MILIGQCFVEDGIGSCSSGTTCFAIWSDEAMVQGCTDDTPIELQIQTTINVTTHEEMREILFKCNYNECNGRSVVSEWETYIDRYYDMSPVRKAFGYNKSMEATQTTTTTVHLTYSLNLQNSTAIPLSSSIQSSPSSPSSKTSTSSVTQPSQSATSTTKQSSKSETSTAKQSSKMTTTIPKSCCSTWSFKSIMMTVTFAAFLLLLARHCFDLH